jgi:Ca-activated chloride channel family protein
MLQKLARRRAPLASFLLALGAVVFAPHAAAQDASQRVTPGALSAFGVKGRARGLCPLKHTDVRASVAGFLARVTVTQEFENPFTEKIEAVYTFPLPQAAAVDDMTMRVGERTVKSKIMRREEAGEVYRAARDAGQVASLLDQERPNVFTQSVANVMPGERVTVTISYVETLKYEAGTYEFTFPMVVGPRYIPGTPAGRRPPRGSGRRQGTDRVPDASRVTQAAAPRGLRAGHDISVEVALDAGVPVEGLKSPSHEIDVERPLPTSARVRLKNLAAIPNKDFILRYGVAGSKIQDAVLTHRDSRGGYFTLILQPPRRVTAADVTPKELVFVLDTSGSMEGFPIEKAKETMGLALDGLYPQDTFNLITFAGDTHVLFEEPLPATPQNLSKAKRFLKSREGDGGTEMMDAIRTALAPSDAQGHVRIVCFMTDGEVGNDFEIIAEVQKHPNARVFSFGVGDSVNRFLLDKMAEHGRGAVEYVSLEEDGSLAARRFHERVRNPLLTDIQIDWGGLQVTDVYPRRIPDLFGSGPVIVSGRYTGGGRGVVRLRGTMSGQAFEREIAVELPESRADNEVLATLWARRRVEDLLSDDYEGAQSGEVREDLRGEITGLGLEYRLLTQFTSFVAVEETTVTDGGRPRRIDVPVEVPEGTTPQDADDEDLNTVSASGAAGSRPVQMQKEMSVVAPYRKSNRGVTIAGGAGSGGAGMGAAPMVVVVNEPAPPPPPPATPAPTPRLEPVVARPDPEEQKRRAFLAKLHPLVASVVERLREGKATPGEAEATFVRDGKVELRIWLTEKSPEVLAQLKELGFELILDAPSAGLVVGRMPIEKLSALADVQAVRYVGPEVSRK